MGGAGTAVRNAQALYCAATEPSLKKAAAQGGRYLDAGMIIHGNDHSIAIFGKTQGGLIRCLRKYKAAANARTCASVEVARNCPRPALWLDACLPTARLCVGAMPTRPGPESPRVIQTPASQRYLCVIGSNGLLTFYIDLPQVLDDMYKSGARSFSASQLSQAVVGFNSVITCWNQAASRQHFGVWWHGTSGQVADIAVTQSIDQFFSNPYRLSRQSMEVTTTNKG
jgi:hypothetical protein